jgi:anti-sigma factor RsiW
VISCGDAVNRLWAYLDVSLGTVEQRTVEKHLTLCRRCCGEMEFAVELRRLLSDAGHWEIPDDVRRRLDQTLEEWGP